MESVTGKGSGTHYLAGAGSENCYGFGHGMGSGWGYGDIGSGKGFISGHGAVKHEKGYGMGTGSGYSVVIADRFDCTGGEQYEKH